MQSIRKKIVLLGATGSIGASALRVIEAHPDRLELIGVSARSSVEELVAITRKFAVPHACLSGSPTPVKRMDPIHFSSTEWHHGEEGLAEIADLEDADLVVVATAGTDALLPTLRAIRSGKDIAIANKEILVMAGAFIQQAAQQSGSRLLPADSEHNAVFQCLQGHPVEQVRRILLTASGGPFRDHSLERLAQVTPREALRHPNWSMGDKITIDSATMANKGLEVIEAHWLFGVDSKRIEVVVHPQSLVHSMVEFQDGSLLAQLSPPVMTFALQHCLLYPERAPGVDPGMDFSTALRMDFAPPDLEKFPCLRLAFQSLEAGGCGPAIFNAANEVAVQAFLTDSLEFTGIPRVIAQCLDQMEIMEPESLEEVLQIDRETRRVANEFCRRPL